jgi:hypothetical protein
MVLPRISHRTAVMGRTESQFRLPSQAVTSAGGELRAGPVGPVLGDHLAGVVQLLGVLGHLVDLVLVPAVGLANGGQGDGRPRLRNWLAEVSANGVMVRQCGSGIAAPSMHSVAPAGGWARTGVDRLVAGRLAGVGVAVELAGPVVVPVAQHRLGGGGADHGRRGGVGAVGGIAQGCHPIIRPGRRRDPTEPHLGGEP